MSATVLAVTSLHQQSDPVWLRVSAGRILDTPDCPEDAATALLDALFAALHDPECAKTVLAYQQLPWQYRAPQAVFSKASHSLGLLQDLSGDALAQLTATACLCRLCLTEIANFGQDNKSKAILPEDSFCQSVLESGCFATITFIMYTALKVSSFSHCLRLLAASGSAVQTDRLRPVSSWL